MLSATPNSSAAENPETRARLHQESAAVQPRPILSLGLEFRRLEVPFSNRRRSTISRIRSLRFSRDNPIQAIQF